MLIHATHARQPRRGIVLLSVLVVVVLLSLAAYQYSDLMLAEYKAAVNAHEAVQARHFADSGIHYVAALLSSEDNITLVNGNLFDNPESFGDVVIWSDDGKGKGGRFRLIGPADGDGESSGTGRAGITDESGKINPNALMRIDPTGKLLYDALLKLPNMTDELAACIVDWIDADDTPRQGGAENDYYSGENKPYRAKNTALDTLGELLLVKGVTREVLYGNDLNGNGIQDGDEGADVEGFSRGLSAHLTVHSREQNVDAAGLALTYINETDLALLYEKLAPELTDDLAKFVIMYQQYGPASTDSKQSSQQAAGGKTSKKGKGQTQTPKTIQGNLASWSPDFEKKTKQKVTSFFDLVTAQVSIPGKSQKDPATIYKSPLSDTAQRRELMPKLFEHATIFEESDIPARININTAPAEVLAAIPDLTEADVQAIIALRPKFGETTPPDPIYDTLAWLLTEANLKPDSLKKVEKYITARTIAQVYRVQAVGYFDGAGPSARIEAVIDVNAFRPRIMLWRELTELGTPKRIED